MDEATFQQELINLKRQVAGMSIQNGPQEAVPQDAAMFGELASARFTKQLRALNSHVLSLQSDLIHSWHSQHESRQAPSVEVRSPLRVVEATRMLPQRDTSFLQTSPARDSSAPLVASLDRLDWRVANIERIVSDIEDKLDGMDPTRFTPAASDDGKSCAHIHGLDDPPGLASTNQSKVGSSSAHMDQDRNDRGDSAEPAATWTPQRFTSDGPNTEYTAAAAVAAAAAAAADTYVTNAESIKFRDREIARLEELLRGTQQRLREKEELVVEKDRIIQKLQSENATRQQRVEAPPSFTPRTWGESLPQTKMVISRHAADLATRQGEIEREFASLRDDIKGLVLSLHQERTPHSQEAFVAKDDEMRRHQQSHMRSMQNASPQEHLTNSLLRGEDKGAGVLSRTADVYLNDLQHAHHHKFGRENVWKARDTEVARLRA